MKMRAICSVDMSMPYSPDSCNSRHISPLSTQSASLGNWGGSSVPSLAACTQKTCLCFKRLKNLSIYLPSATLVILEKHSFCEKKQADLRHMVLLRSMPWEGCQCRILAAASQGSNSRCPGRVA